MLFKVKNTVTRDIKIETEATSDVLVIEWEKPSLSDAAELHDMMIDAQSRWIKYEGEEKVRLSFSEAVKDYTRIKSENSGEVVIPLLHDGVIELSNGEIIDQQKEMLKLLMIGEGALFKSWNLKESEDDEPMQMHVETFEYVFEYSEFFNAVYKDTKDMLLEFINGADVEKNSQKSVKNGLKHRLKSRKATMKA